MRQLYRITNELTGCKNGGNVPVKNINGENLASKVEQEKRWIEHFSNVLNQEPPQRPLVLTEEDHFIEQPNFDDGIILVEEVQSAIKHLKNNKAPGLDNIHAEFLKHGGEELVKKLTVICNTIWENEIVPDDWQKGSIIKLPKKGDLSICDNWRGITLLSVPGKILNYILLTRLKNSLDSLLRENQAGFRNGRSCSEQIFTTRQLIEQSIEWQSNLVLNFIDFKKAFDSVHRESLWKILELYGIPQKFKNIIKAQYVGCKCCIKTEEGYSEFFDIRSGVRQGCILSPFLFIILVDFMMRKATKDDTHGIKWSTHSKLSDLDFADDIALIDTSIPSMQELTNNVISVGNQIGLRINVDKTEYMLVNIDNVQPILIDAKPLKLTEKFNYLGSVIDSTGDSESDVLVRIGKGYGVFRRLNKIWRSRLSLDIKLNLFKTIVIPTVIYSCENWKSSTTIVNKLNVFQQRCLRKILNVSYRDRITNQAILTRSKVDSLATTVEKRRLSWLGHLLRMNSSRYATKALSWTPEGRRKRGRPKNTWRRTVENDLTIRGMGWYSVKRAAADRRRWKKIAAKYPELDGRT